MHISTRKVQGTAALLLSVFAAGLLGSPAQAADAAWLAHRAIRNKILHEASDRYDVRFLTTHTDRLAGNLREVTGKGRFRRRGKTAQNFTYHTTVNIRNNSDKNTGYDIR